MNQPRPTAIPDAFSLEQEEASAQLGVLANDHNPNRTTLTISIMQAPQHGTATANLSDVTYTPDTSGFAGIDSFTYAITDPAGNRSAATATIFINKPANSAPLSTPYPWQRLSAHTVTLPPATLTCAISLNDLLAIAGDADGDPLVVYSIDAPEIGCLTAAAGGQFQYARDTGRFGTDAFTYIVADANGGFDTATIVIKQADSDIDGMPDDWENSHNLNPLAGDAMGDPDQDTLPNLAEYALHTNPQAADNPLNLSALNMTSGYLDLPLNISPEVDPNTPFVVLVDGNEVQLGSGVNVLRHPDGTWHLQLNPIFENGEHTLALGIRYTAEDWDDSWQTVMGSTETLTVNNAFILEPSSCTYDGGLLLSAALNVPAISCSIEIRDSQNHPLTTLSPVPSGGAITADWDGTDGSGNPIAEGPLTVTFNLVPPDGGSPASGTAVISPQDCKCGKDVTKLVYETLKDITAVYESSSWIKRQLALIQIKTGQPWDIQYFKDRHTDIFEDNLKCPPCRPTVTFEGQCVSADELNYMLLGLAFALDKATDPIELLQGFDILLISRDDDETEVRLRKVRFAAYAMKQFGRAPQIPDNHYFPVKISDLKWPSNCPITGKVAKRSSSQSSVYPQNWYWNGIRTFLEIPAPPPFP